MYPRISLAVACFLAAICLAGCPANQSPTDTNSNTADSSENDNNTSSDASAVPAPGFRPTPTEPPPSSTAGAVTLLNELVYDPEPGQSQFVELKTGTDARATSTLKLQTETGDTYQLPADAPQPAPGGIVLIVFDGGGNVVDGVVHADRASLLNPVSGTIALLDETGLFLDSLAWGEDRPASVPLGNGGVPGNLPHGTVFARRPDSISPRTHGDWVTTDPLQSTPGGPNRNPGVEILIPLHGALVEAGPRLLTWYPVNGAAHYRVQLAADAEFTNVIADETVDSPAFERTTDPGDYFWRVQSIAPDGSLADFSASSQFTVVANFDDFFASLDATEKLKGRSAAKSGQLDHVVPLFAQRKDTHMLLLESNKEDGAHAWNTPHAIDRERYDCLADKTNCSLASISMVNSYFAPAGAPRPNLSQDRIGLAVYSSSQFELRPGPEQDLNFNRGFQDPEITFGLNWALHVAPQYHSALAGLSNDQIIWAKLRNTVPPGFLTSFFADLKASVAANKPVLFVVLNQGSLMRHTMVAQRWAESGGIRWVGINDPWPPEFRWQKLEEMLLNAYWILPDGATSESDNPEYLSPPGSSNDSDRDKVSNYEEVIRFETDASKKDTDKDCVEDLDEIRNSVFDDKHGWGRYSTAQAGGDGSDSDGKARADRRPEKTNDSDGGGLPDYVEDLNMDGRIDRDKGESDPFDPNDDPRTIKGKVTTYRDRDDPPNHFLGVYEGEFELHVNKDGTITGTGKATYNESNVLQSGAAPPQCPQPREIRTVYDEARADVQVEGEFVCNDDALGPALIVRTKEPVPTYNKATTIFDPCLGDNRGFSGTYPIMVAGVFPPEPDGYFTSRDKVQWKFVRYTSTLPTEKNFRTEWDVTMTP